MKRLHVHLGVENLANSVRFYSVLFKAEPTVLEADYAKWMLDDPRVNFAISTRGVVGLDHLGVQVESAADLRDIAGRLEAAEAQVVQQRDAVCCYARSDKAWIIDPQGIHWETFHSHGTTTVYGEDRRAVMGSSACCALNPDSMSPTSVTSGCGMRPSTADAPAAPCCAE